MQAGLQPSCLQYAILENACHIWAP